MLNLSSLLQYLHWPPDWCLLSSYPTFCNFFQKKLTGHHASAIKFARASWGAVTSETCRAAAPFLLQWADPLGTSCRKQGEEGKKVMKRKKGRRKTAVGVFIQNRVSCNSRAWVVRLWSDSSRACNHVSPSMIRVWKFWLELDNKANQKMWVFWVEIGIFISLPHTAYTCSTPMCYCVLPEQTMKTQAPSTRGAATSLCITEDIN